MNPSSFRRTNYWSAWIWAIADPKTELCLSRGTSEMNLSPFGNSLLGEQGHNETPINIALHFSQTWGRALRPNGGKASRGCPPAPRWPHQPGTPALAGHLFNLGPNFSGRNYFDLLGWPGGDVVNNDDFGLLANRGIWLLHFC
ncbi:uncharacterized protein A4U43_C07F26410 [Asparagus officinalis]|uniref:Uncharacterized protein n=1 Tax=Asparagus officinalis TaxID=4686 RepID=A0A5P1EK93_ASPOF|nr:uncharacterized protein A4U43_C07F26410 [Asparagus officinalis]